MPSDPMTKAAAEALLHGTNRPLRIHDGVVSSADMRLAAAAPDLARSVVALHTDVDRLRRELGEARRLLRKVTDILDKSKEAATSPWMLYPRKAAYREIEEAVTEARARLDDTDAEGGSDE